MVSPSPVPPSRTDTRGIDPIESLSEMGKVLFAGIPSPVSRTDKSDERPILLRAAERHRPRWSACGVAHCRGEFVSIRRRWCGSAVTVSEVRERRYRTAAELAHGGVALLSERLAKSSGNRDHAPIFSVSCSASERARSNISWTIRVVLSVALIDFGQRLARCRRRKLPDRRGRGLYSL